MSTDQTTDGLQESEKIENSIVTPEVETTEKTSANAEIPLEEVSEKETIETTETTTEVQSRNMAGAQNWKKKHLVFRRARSRKLFRLETIGSSCTA